ncbi:MAG TPA: hypothetical protein PLS49_02315 [Candidatus Woesebacteria bacterium]|nr:hypothetical protein [Candidatus Woesebacteria bacterium]
MKRANNFYRKGQTLVTLLVFSVVALTVATAAVAIMINIAQATNRVEGNITALQIAESGAENALLRLLRNPSYTGETLQVGDGTAVITISGTTTKTVTVVGTLDSHTKTVQVVATFTNGIMTVTSWREI